jgi:hypothetical protein
MNILATCRHSRESGNPFCLDQVNKIKMDSRFRGNDGLAFPNCA